MNKLKLILGDITQSATDVIVNAANGSLLGGGGVDGAIHRESGPELLAYCKQLPCKHGVRCATGEAVLTPGFKLNAKHIIHTVGPIYHQHSKADNRRLLANCYHNSLALAEQINAKSIAFPAISTGVYGYPMAEAAEVAIQTCRRFHYILDINFYLFDPAALNTWQAQLETLTS